jgi:hypothetical protein
MIEENTKENTKKEVIYLYEEYDRKYPNGWGWCSLDKAGCFIDYVDELFKIKNRPITCVEIGVYAGKSLFPVAIHLFNENSGKIIGIEPWSNEEATKDYSDQNFEFWNNVDMEEIQTIFYSILNDFFHLEDHIEIRKESSDETRPIQDIDFLYIDGQHTKQVLKDIDKFATEVTKNGYCVVDDVNWDTEAMEQVPNKMEQIGFTLVHQVDAALVYRKFVENTSKNL